MLYCKRFFIILNEFQEHNFYDHVVLHLLCFEVTPVNSKQSPMQNNNNVIFTRNVLIMKDKKASCMLITLRTSKRKMEAIIQVI